jgi:hypothetical protein
MMRETLSSKWSGHEEVLPHHLYIDIHISHKCENMHFLAILKHNVRWNPKMENSFVNVLIDF